MNRQNECTFILTTSQAKSINKIQEIGAKIYLDYEKSINLNTCFRYAFLKDNFQLEQEKDFNEYYNNNVHLVTDEDLKSVFSSLRPLLVDILENVLLGKNYQYTFTYASSVNEMLISILNTH